MFLNLLFFSGDFFYVLPLQLDPSSAASLDAAAAAAASSSSGRAARFRDRVISDVHEIDGDEAPALPSRLTESELQLGKVR